MNVITIIQMIVGRDGPGPGLLFKEFGTKVIPVDRADVIRGASLQEIVQRRVVNQIRAHIDSYGDLSGFLTHKGFRHFVIVNEMVVSGRFRANVLCALPGVFVGLFAQFKQAGTFGRFFVLYPTDRAILNCNDVFHNGKY